MSNTLLNTYPSEDILIDAIGDEHVGTSYETPLREDAFLLDDDTKIEMIETMIINSMRV